MTNMLEKNLWWMYRHLAASHQTFQQTQWIKGQTSLGLIRKPHNEQAVNSLQLPLWDTRASDHTELLNLIKLFNRKMAAFQGCLVKKNPHFDRYHVCDCGVNISQKAKQAWTVGLWECQGVYEHSVPPRQTMQ